ncbi:hypothetical protein F5B21DRAFT_528737 [Xylaria acuta]|nr:hypothetical protein F5B21DRAFT_528737 [Xylaria acuta]
MPAPRTSQTITVDNGAKTRLFFVSITGLQQGTRFMDIWKHLKKSVKRIEHVEVFPESSDGWVCINKHSNFLKAIEVFRTPLYVESTNTSTVITTGETNVDDPITIRCPRTISAYALKMIRMAIKPHKTYEPVVTSAGHKIVIAHGTYIPGAAWNNYGPLSPQPIDESPLWNHCAPSTPSSTSSFPYYYTQPAWPPSPPTSHTVSLGGFHHKTTLRRVQMAVQGVSSRCELNDPNVQFVDGSTITTSDKADARRLRRALDGMRLDGASITATRGQRPYEFGTYPYPYPYSGFQNWGQDWWQDWWPQWGQQNWWPHWEQNWGYNWGY